MFDFHWSVGTGTDDTGEQAPTVSLVFGPGGRHLAQNLEPDVPVNFKLTFQVSEQARSATLVLYVRLAGADDYSTLVLRSIPIR
jgi:hypothetical protein